MLNLNRLALLQELYRRGSILAVAEALSYTPSTVSQQIKVLEKEVGVSLTERVGRGLRSTASGILLAKRAELIFAEVERAEAEIASVNTTAQGDIRVAVLQTASLAVLPASLDLLRAQAPNLRMLVRRIEPARAIGALRAREFDLVLGEEYPGLPIERDESLVIETLLDDPLDLVLPANYSGEMTLHAAASCLPWVMEPAGSDARSWAVGACRENGMEPDVQFDSDDLLVQMRLVETGQAIAILPRMILQSESPKLQRMELPGLPTRSIFWAARASSAQTPAIRLVIEAFRGAINSLNPLTD